MNFGFNNEKEKVEMYSKEDANQKILDELYDFLDIASASTTSKTIPANSAMESISIPYPLRTGYKGLMVSGWRISGLDEKVRIIGMYVSGSDVIIDFMNDSNSSKTVYINLLKVLCKRNVY